MPRDVHGVSHHFVDHQEPDLTPELKSVEGRVLGSIMTALERRQDRIEMEMPEHITKAVGDAMAAVSARSLTPDELMWVKLAIKREAQSIDFRQKVIQSSTIGLVWLFIGGVLTIIYEWIKSHGWKP